MPRIRKSAQEPKTPVEITGRNPECKRCPLHKESKAGDKELVCLWGVGNQQAKLMLIGEAPGADELKDETPFVGQAGQVLNKYLKAAGVDRSTLYVTNAVKCRPPLSRPPKPMETKACAPYVDFEIAQIKPVVIGLLGASAMKRILGVDGITKLRGKPMWSEKYKCWCVATWHPSFLLRNGEPFVETEQFKRDLAYMQKIAETGTTGQLVTEITDVCTTEQWEQFKTDISAAKYVSIDTETWGDYLTGKILTVQFSWKSGTASVIRFYKTGPEYTEPTDKIWPESQEKEIWSFLKAYLENPDTGKVGQNIKYDYEFFKLYGISMRGVIFDTMLGHYLLDENDIGSHDLTSLSLRFTDMGDYSAESYDAMGVTSDQMSDHEFASKMWIKATPEVITKYAGRDADCQFRVFCALYPKLKAEGLLPLLQKLMIPLSFELAEMELNGVCVDVDYYKNLCADYEKKIEEVQKRLLEFKEVKILEEVQEKPVNFNSPPQMKVLLYEILKAPILKYTNDKKKKNKSAEKNPSTDEEVLTKLADMGYEFCKVLLENRKLNKFLSTYIRPIPEIIKSDGKLHTSYQQHITVTGRLSSSKPNLQNIPKKEPQKAKEVRNGIIASPGCKLMEADFKQIEFRLWANESQDPTMIADIAKDLDIHKETASKSFHIPVDQVPKDVREKAKTITYSVVYGKGEENLAKENNLTVEEVKSVLSVIFGRYPVAEKWINDTKKRAEQMGFVTNWAGRKRRLTESFKSKNEGVKNEARRQAVNSPIQGGAHDIVTVATLRVAAELRARNLKSKLVMTIHDALVVDTKEEEIDTVAEILRTKMEQSIPKITVPLKVDISIGARLGEMESYKPKQVTT